MDQTRKDRINSTAITASGGRWLALQANMIFCSTWPTNMFLPAISLELVNPVEMILYPPTWKEVDIQPMTMFGIQM